VVHQLRHRLRRFPLQRQRDQCPHLCGNLGGGDRRRRADAVLDARHAAAARGDSAADGVLPPRRHHVLGNRGAVAVHARSIGQPVPATIPLARLDLAAERRHQCGVRRHLRADGVFLGSGGWIVVFGGALSSLPAEVTEAAKIDGANRWQMAMLIKLPMIWRSVALMAILCFAGGLQIFVEPQLMELAGQQYSRSDWSVNQLAFQYAFSMGDFGTSAALSTMLLTASIAIALIIIFATKFYKID
jgi:hypothetical protein